MNPPIPKIEWGPGPWQDEPDEFRWIHAGLDCYIYRHLHLTGSLNGYVAVPPEHRWWGKTTGECIELPQCEPDPPFDYEAMAKEGWPVPAPGSRLRSHMSDTQWSCAHRVEALLEVHGGVTYAGPMTMIAGDDAAAAEHFAWGFGFDTGHAGDVTPAMDALLRQLGHERERYMAMSGFPDAMTNLFHDTYRTFDYVKRETENLAEQLALVQRQGWSGLQSWDRESLGNDGPGAQEQAVV